MVNSRNPEGQDLAVVLFHRPEELEVGQGRDQVAGDLGSAGVGPPVGQLSALVGVAEEHVGVLPVEVAGAGGVAVPVDLDDEIAQLGVGAGAVDQEQLGQIVDTVAGLQQALEPGGGLRVVGQVARREHPGDDVLHPAGRGLRDGAAFKHDPRQIDRRHPRHPLPEQG